MSYDTWRGSWGAAWGLSWTRGAPTPEVTQLVGDPYDDRNERILQDDEEIAIALAGLLPQILRRYF